MGIFSFFGKQSLDPLAPPLTDMHSHLINGVDDGSETLDQSLELLSKFAEIGYSKVITTPHIMGDFYKNSADNLLPKRDIIREELSKRNINIEFDCAAEYYLDEFFIKMLRENKELLSFGKEKYVLFETSFMNKPIQMDEVIFELMSNGYKPVLAHPERYFYFHGSYESYQELASKGVLLQININSLTGYYSNGIKKICEKLIDDGIVHFMSSDCHNLKHFGITDQARQEKYYHKAMELPLINKHVI